MSELEPSAVITLPLLLAPDVPILGGKIHLVSNARCELVNCTAPGSTQHAQLQSTQKQCWPRNLDPFASFSKLHRPPDRFMSCIRLGT